MPLWVSVGEELVMVTANETDLVTVDEAASLLKVDRSTIRRWIREGSLPAYRVGPRRVRIKRADLSTTLSPFSPPASPLERQLGGDIRLSVADQRRMLEAADRAEQLHREQRARAGGDPNVPPSWLLLHEAREERWRQLR